MLDPQDALPGWLDFEADAAAAANLVRGLIGHSASWERLLASAQAIMGYYQDIQGTQDNIINLYREERARPLIAASRILDAASQMPETISTNVRQDLAITATVSFGMYANFPSAEAAARRFLEVEAMITPSLAVILSTSAPNLLPRLLGSVLPDTPERDYLERLNYYLFSANAQAPDRLRALLIACLRTASSIFESSLLRSCRLTLEHLFTLSVSRVLQHEIGGLPAAHIRLLVENGIRVLLPPQFNVLVTQGLLASDSNAIVALPTGTGKTLLGELTLVASLRDRPGMACYVTPYLALGRQVADTLQRHLPPEFTVHRMFGGYKEPDILDPEMNKE